MRFSFIVIYLDMYILSYFYFIFISFYFITIHVQEPLNRARAREGETCNLTPLIKRAAYNVALILV